MSRLKPNNRADLVTFQSVWFKTALILLLVTSASVMLSEAVGADAELTQLPRCH